jgi:hypothetical protein
MAIENLRRFFEQQFNENNDSYVFIYLAIHCAYWLQWVAAARSVEFGENALFAR